MAIVYAVTLIYVIAFGSGPLFIKNKLRYMSYMCSLCPRYFGTLLVSAGTIPFVIFPANIIYLVCLGRFADIHNDIVTQMNIDGEV